MKPNHIWKRLTFGDRIANDYSAYGNRRAKGILRLQTKAHLVGFRWRNGYVLSGGDGKA
jgi:hypothetical protein